MKGRYGGLKIVAAILGGAALITLLLCGGKDQQLVSDSNKDLADSNSQPNNSDRVGKDSHVQVLNGISEKSESTKKILSGIQKAQTVGSSIVNIAGAIGSAAIGVRQVLDCFNSNSDSYSLLNDPRLCEGFGENVIIPSSLNRVSSQYVDPYSARSRLTYIDEMPEGAWCKVTNDHGSAVIRKTTNPYGVTILEV